MYWDCAKVRETGRFCLDVASQVQSTNSPTMYGTTLASAAALLGAVYAAMGMYVSTCGRGSVATWNYRVVGQRM